MRAGFRRFQRGDLTRAEVARGVVYRLLGVVLTVLVAVGAGLLLPARRSGAEAGAPGPRLEQAVAVARTEFGLLSGGGWGQAWTLWSDDARRTLPETGFVQLNAECRPVLGVPYVIVQSTVVGPGHARVAWHRGGESGSDDLLFEDGTWHFVPDAATLHGFGPGGGAEQAVRERKAAGECH